MDINLQQKFNIQHVGIYFLKEPKSYLNLTVSFSWGSSGLFSRRIPRPVGILFQSTEENSIIDLFIALTKTASSGFSNGTLQK